MPLCARSTKRQFSLTTPLLPVCASETLSPFVSTAPFHHFTPAVPWYPFAPFAVPWYLLRRLQYPGTFSPCSTLVPLFAVPVPGAVRALGADAAHRRGAHHRLHAQRSHRPLHVHLQGAGPARAREGRASTPCRVGHGFHTLWDGSGLPHPVVCVSQDSHTMHSQ